MEKICGICTATNIEKAKFCSNCGSQLSCLNCSAPLVSNAKNCIECGVSVSQKTNASNEAAMNTINYKRTKEETTYSVAFTDNVGKDISGLLVQMAGNNMGTAKMIQQSIDNNDTEEIADSNYFIDTEIEEVSTVTANGNTEFAHINDIQQLPCSEADYLLIMAFYCSNYGSTTFSKEQVKELYVEHRETDARKKNYAANWKSLLGVQKNYITTIKEGALKLTPKAIAKVKSLINGEKQNNVTVSKPSVKRKAKSNSENETQVDKKIKKTVAKSIVQEEFDVHKNSSKKSLEEFFNEKKPENSTSHRILCIAYYIMKICKKQYFSEGNIDYAYRSLQLKGRPNHLTQTITNLKNEKVWFEKIVVDGKKVWKISRQGETYVEDKLPPKGDN